MPAARPSRYHRGGGGVLLQEDEDEGDGDADGGGGVPRYSPTMGLVYIFNLIVGTGALTLPSALRDAGWGLGSAVIVMLAFMSYLTTTFVIESMAAANAMHHFRRAQSLKRSGLSVSETATAAAEDGDDDGDRSQPSPVRRNVDEREPLIASAPPPPVDEDYSRRGSVPNIVFYNRQCGSNPYYKIDEIIEMGRMATLFFNRTGRTLFYICITIYLYGDLAIYGAAVAKSLRDVSCTYVPSNASKSHGNISESAPCWPTSDMTRIDAYRVFLVGFTCVAGPFVFFNVTKTKYLQILTTFMRWMAFTCMVALACIRLARGTRAYPPVANFNGIPNMFGVCVYSFMCHHSLPTLVTPISNKRRINSLIALDYLAILAFYCLLAFTGIFAFQEINDLYTLNFQPEPGEPAYLLLVHYFLSLFPVFTLSTNFPIIAITLRNNLKSLFLTEGRMYSWCTRQCVFPVLALVPPVSVALVTNSLEFLIGITGSYAGAGIQYVVPAFLVYYSRKATHKAIGVGVRNHHSSWFRSTAWVVFVQGWAVACIVLVTWNHIAAAFS